VHRFAADAFADLGVNISQMIPYRKTLLQSMKQNMPLAGRYLTSGVIYIILIQYPHFSSTSSDWIAICSKEMINNV